MLLPFRYFLFIAIYYLLFLSPVFAQNDSDLINKTYKDKIEHPYFVVNGATALDALPLKSTEVNVRIMGVIADVQIIQHYHNSGSAPLEAQYVFPGSTRSAVYAMQVKLADRILNAEIREKEQAKIEYNQAKEEGKTAALLEQHRPNVFQMNVANIMPADDIIVELRYTELLIPNNNHYEFVFPTVVGPRYNGKKETGSGTDEQWISTPYLLEKTNNPSKFNITVQLMTPVKLAALTSPSHEITSATTDINDGWNRKIISKSQTELTLTTASDNPNNRDFILRYQLGDKTIGNGILISQSKTDENFFVAMMAPPTEVSRDLIVPREYIFIVDISGSMHGFPLDTAKQLINELIGSLRASDTFNIMLFSGSNTMLAESSLPATEENIRKGLALIKQTSAQGSTELVPALKKALALEKTQDQARTFVIITDGYVSVKKNIFKIIRKNLNQANLFAFGIGSSVNRHLIEGMAHAGQGEPFIVTNKIDAKRAATDLKEMIDSPILTGITADFVGFDTYDIEPHSIPDLFANRPVVLFGKWRGELQGKILLKGQSASGPYQTEIPITADSANENSSALRYLWARNKIEQLMDQQLLEGEQDDIKEAITKLGLQYSLLTEYTSFIAIDKIIRNQNPSEQPTVVQPLPLPQGVTNSAIGASVSATPEPETWMMMVIALIGMGLFIRNRRMISKHL